MINDEKDLRVANNKKWDSVCTAKVESDELLTIDELSQKLKVPKSFLYAPCRRKGPNAIPCIRIGKYIRYHLPTVRAHFAKQSDAL